MARTYLYGRNAIFRGTVADFQSAALRAVLVQPASTYLSENPATMGAFSALTILTASDGEVIANPVINLDTVRDRLYFTADDPVWAGLTTGEIVQGLVLYLHVTDFASSIPLIAFPRPVPQTIPIAGTYTWEWGDDGVFEA